MDNLTFLNQLGECKLFHIESILLTHDVPKHTHEFIELAYIEQGTLFHECNNQMQTIRQGDYFIIDKSISHILRYTGTPARVINVLFMPAFLDSTFSRVETFDELIKTHLLPFNKQFCFNPYSGQVFQDADQFVLQLLLKMMDEYASSRTGSAVLLRAYLLELTIHMMRELHVSEASIDPDIAAVQEQIHEQMASPLSLKALAKEHGMSEAHLSRKFHENCGLTFSHYVQRVRMQHACRLLLDTDKKISDIAHCVGYEDVKFFHKLFLKHIGTTPAAFRRSYGQGFMGL